MINIAVSHLPSVKPPVEECTRSSDKRLRNGKAGSLGARREDRRQEVMRLWSTAHAVGPYEHDGKVWWICDPATFGEESAMSAIAWHHRLSRCLIGNANPARGQDLPDVSA